MRVKPNEYTEFMARFYCAAKPNDRHNVPVEIETVGGGLGRTVYVSDSVSAKAADWLKLYRIASDVQQMLHPEPVAKSIPSDVGPVPDPPPSMFVTATVTSPPQAAQAPEDLVLQAFETHRRDCPKCGQRIMRAATLCGYCWTKLTADEPLSVSTQSAYSHPYIEPVSPIAKQRPCPSCGKLGMADASVCGYCWTRT